MSIAETIAALVLLMISCSIGILIFVNVFKNDQYRLKTLANIYLQAIYLESLNGENRKNETLDFEDFRIKKIWKAYSSQTIDTKGLYLLELEALENNGKIILEQRHLIYDAQ